MAKTLPTIRDYISAIENSKTINVAELLGGIPITKNGKLLRYSGGFCIVFPYNVMGKKYAIRCWHANLSHAKDRIKLIAEDLNKIKLPYFVNFKYVESAINTIQGVQPIVLMDWVEAQPIKEYIKDCLGETSKLKDLARNFLEMVKVLHQNNIAHGDLQHGNVLVKPSGDIVLVDYDSMYVPALNGWNDEIKGLPGYQHPGRIKNKYLSEKIDYFSELVIYISIIALSHNPQLWDKTKMADSDTMLFSEKDIESRGSSPIFAELKKELELIPLINKLIDFMQCQTIDEILPLEDAIKSPVDRIVEKWRIYTPPAPIHSKCKLTDEDMENITSKW